MKKLYESESFEAYMRDLCRLTPLSKDEEKEVGRRIQAGDTDALETLVIRNLRYVISVALKYANDHIPADDLVQAGAIGMMEAAKKFDPERNIKFITYAAMRVKNRIQRYISQGAYPVHLPDNTMSNVAQVSRALEDIYKEQREWKIPPTEEIQKRVTSNKSLINAIILSKMPVGSLDMPERGGAIGANGRLSLHKNWVTDPNPMHDEDADREKIAALLAKVMERLTKREKEVVNLRFGLDGAEPLTLEQTAEVMRPKVTRERIRQIQRRAMRKMLTNRDLETVQALAALVDIDPDECTAKREQARREYMKRRNDEIARTQRRQKNGMAH